MYLSRIRLWKQAVREPELWRRLGDAYQVHRQIWSLLPQDRDSGRDFLYRREDQANTPTFFLLSQRRPLSGDSLWDVESKLFEPILREGDSLLFVLRANPIRSRWEGDEKQKRHDVVMDARTRLENDGVARKDWPSLAEIVQAEGYAWLFARAERCGFAVAKEQVLADGYRQHQFLKPRRNALVRLSTLELSGRLTVTDPTRFLDALYHGIGPAKAFGCGLMLVKRI